MRRLQVHQLLRVDRALRDGQLADRRLERLLHESLLDATAIQIQSRVVRRQAGADLLYGRLMLHGASDDLECRLQGVRDRVDVMLRDHVLVRPLTLDAVYDRFVEMRIVRNGRRPNEHRLLDSMPRPDVIKRHSLHVSRLDRTLLMLFLHIKR